MHPVSCGLLEDQGLVAPGARRSLDGADPMGWGLVCSVALHVVVALLFVFGLRSLLQAPALVEVPVLVEVVQFDREGTSPGGQTEAGQQQERPPRPASQEPTAPNASAAVEPQSRTQPPRSISSQLPKRDTAAGIEPQPRKKPPSHDDIDILLKLAENSHGRAATSPGGEPRNGPASPDLTATNDHGARGQHGARGVKDFIRAQIERHWEFDLRDLGAAELVISIHLQLNADGSVAKVEIVDDPRYASEPHFRSIASSARNAVLASSPLHLPPGTYDAVKDITLNLNPREALR